MTESTQLQTTENNNSAVVKMEPPPPPAPSGASSSTSDTPDTSAVIEQLHQSAQQHQIFQQQQQQYALKWNDFQSSILSSFRHLRDEEDFVDVTLACDQRSFTAHKVVLSACSPYFRKLLKANPCEHPIVILRDVCPNDVENLLSFMYNGEVNISYENLSDFLKTAHLLQIRGLADVNSSFPTSFDPPTKSITTSLRNTINNLSNNNNNAKCSKNSNNNSSSNEMLNFPPANNNTTNSATNALSFSAPTFTAPGTGNIAPTLNSNSLIGSSIVGSMANTPAVQELKASSASPANNNWDLTDAETNRSNSHLTPPPQKRIKSADLFRAQHGISPERLLIDRDFPVAGQHPLTRERRDRSRDTSRDRDRNLELRDSLLSQALENNGALGNQKLHTDLSSLHTQSAGEDSNSSDTEPSDRGDGQHDGTTDSINGSMDGHNRSFPNAFLGLQGIPGLLPGPSGINANDFVSRRSLEMRVRATDPRPCPKCGKIYRSAHTLRTHLEDKHTVCPGYRCVLCGTVAKSRNSLHSHMSRQHRGISTKDLPVLPMPSPFDPELASRLLAKAGVKISAAELRARASPTNGGNSSNSGQTKLDITVSGEQNEDAEDSDEDPEDLTTGSGGYTLSANGTTGVNELSRYHESLLSNFSHANSAISRIRNEAAAVAAVALGQQKDLQIPTSSAPGQTLLDTYLQFITENSFGMGISQEHAAAAALHAAKMAQLSAMGHGLDKLPVGIIPPQFDLSKVGVGTNYSNNTTNTNIMEPIMMRTDVNVPSNSSTSENGSPNILQTTNLNNGTNRIEPMDLGLDNNNQPSGDVENSPSDQENNFSEDETVQNS